MAQFIEGWLPYCPNYMAETVDEETRPIIPILARLNRAGFLTTNSQPGASWGTGHQRAWVEGFALEPLAETLVERGLYSSLYVNFYRPHDFPSTNFRNHVPITVDGGHAYTWLPDSPGVLSSPSQEFSSDASLEALDELDRAWWICLADLEWGRQGYLWETLLAPSHEGYSIDVPPVWPDPTDD